MTRQRPVAADVLHARVRAACSDPLAGELLQLHAPSRPAYRRATVCQGCDTVPGADAPLWPCTTFEVLTTSILSLPRRDDVKRLLVGMITDAARLAGLGVPR